jgi:riboflavin-specific deaminase-like protein
MRRLYPAGGEEPLDEVYGDVAAGSGSWVALGMVTSVDGAATVDGVSGGLGQEGDRAAFRGLRAACDVILVGAGTVRAERYGPPRTRPHDVARRAARGQAERPAIAVVSSSLDLTGADRLLEEDPTWRPIVITHRGADPTLVAELTRQGVDVVTAGEARVDLVAAVDALRSRGMRRILCEGGPRLNGQMLAHGLIDEVFVTVAPRLAGGPAPRIVVGDALAETVLELVGVRQHGDEVLLRYRVAR